jgi:hypothetical protein
LTFLPIIVNVALAYAAAIVKIAEDKTVESVALRHVIAEFDACIRGI